MFHWHNTGSYEERITIWHAKSLDDAIRQGEVEARRYAAESEGIKYLDFAQAFAISPNQLGEGTEVFSLLRDSDLESEAYLLTFFDTGSERQT